MSGKRTPIVGGNWKCNGTLASMKTLILELNSASIPKNVECIVAPTNLHIPEAQDNLKNEYQLASQNCGLLGNGAHTGEVSAQMLKDYGVSWVILGHSERRTDNNESNELVGAKVKMALSQQLKVIACIGETLEQRKQGNDYLMGVLKKQITAIGDSVADWDRVVLAYEPIWAIGTGVTASSQQAQDVHVQIRAFVAETYGEEVASKLRIMYGGSVKAKNASELFAMPDIDGFLVGGSSLKGKEFPVIVQKCSGSIPSKL